MEAIIDLMVERWLSNKGFAANYKLFSSSTDTLDLLKRFDDIINEAPEEEAASTSQKWNLARDLFKKRIRRELIKYNCLCLHSSFKAEGVVAEVLKDCGLGSFMLVPVNLKMIVYRDGDFWVCEIYTQRHGREVTMYSSDGKVMGLL